MSRESLIIFFIAFLALNGCEMQNSTVPTPVKIGEQLETGPRESCKVNADCWCRNFTGAEFIPGKVESVCKNNQCVACLYD